MTLSMLTKLAAQGIAKRRTIYFPYFLAVVLIMALEYIMISLISNEYVQTRQAELPTIIMIGVFFSTLLAVIFILYANNFIQRQRRMEFALYTVLGLEGRHIRLIILIEQVLTWFVGSILSIGVGYALGNVMFMLLNRLTQDLGAGLMDYPFSPWAALGTTTIIAGVMFFIYLLNSIRLARLNPAELLSQTHAGESEPKSRWLVLLIGLITLAAGYYIALTTTGVIDALLKVFVAIFLVVIATYALLMSLSIIFLKRLKRNKDYYYQPTHFLSVSGMLYRMKGNATSLAGIAILCTGIVLTLGTTLTLYLGMEEQVEQATSHEFELEYMGYVEGASVEKAETVLNQALSEFATYGDVQDVTLAREGFITSAYSNKDFRPLEPTSKLQPNDFVYIIGVPLEDFNQLYNQDYDLAKNEVLFAGHLDKIQDSDIVTMGEREFHVHTIASSYVPTNYIGQVVYVVFPTIEDVEALAQAFPTYTRNGEELIGSVEYSLVFNAADEEARDNIEANLPEDEILELSDSDLVRVMSAQQIAKSLYSLNGGFLFLGIIVGVVLMIGTVLMLYFKQVSEGYQDQGKFEIMRKVGLPDKLIRQTIRHQIFWIFALPIMIAVIHSLFASKIMFELLGLLSVKNVSTFVIGYGTVLAIFIVVYLLFYFITSRVYYRIIKQ